MRMVVLLWALEATAACTAGGTKDDTAGPAPGPWGAVSAGGRTACALTQGGDLWCWGSDEGGVATTMPSGAHQEVAVGDCYACALATDGVVLCWGSPAEGCYEAGQTTPGAVPPLHGLSAGRTQACGLDEAGSLRCWGREEDAEWWPPEGAFVQVDVGAVGACAVDNSGSIECWGLPELAEKRPRGDGFAQVAVNTHACALNADGSTTCWGTKNSKGPDLDVPEGSVFVSIAAGADITCGITSMGTMSCWGGAEGYPFGDYTSPADGSGWASVSLGNDIGCALSNLGNITCYGYPYDGILEVPDPGE